MDSSDSAPVFFAMVETEPICTQCGLIGTPDGDRITNMRFRVELHPPWVGWICYACLPKDDAGSLDESLSRSPGLDCLDDAD